MTTLLPITAFVNVSYFSVNVPYPPYAYSDKCTLSKYVYCTLRGPLRPLPDFPRLRVPPGRRFPLLRGTPGSDPGTDLVQTAAASAFEDAAGLQGDLGVRTTSREMDANI